MRTKKIIAALVFLVICCSLSLKHGDCRQQKDDAGMKQRVLTEIENMKRCNPDKYRDFQYALRHIRKINKKQKVWVSCAVAKALADHVHREKYRFSSEGHRLNFLSVLMGIIRVESGFDPGAISRKNARGLMQVHWPTWKQYFTSPGEAHDLHRNLSVGTGILRLYMEQSNNDLRHALYKYLGAKDDRYADTVIGSALEFKKSVLLDPVKNED